MKKLIALLLTLIMVLSLAACGTDSKETSGDTAKSDMEYVKDKGKLVVGITEFKPMDYKNEDGEWIGFDADMAKAFAESLGVDVEFVIIDWDYKIMELDGKTIDCVWNGMTLTDEVLAGMSCSNPYCENAQVLVVPSDKADQYQSIADLTGAEITVAVEAGSAGEEQAEGYNLTTTPVTTQADALMEAAGGTSDAAVIDLLMAGAMIGEGTGYEDLVYTVKLNSEEYGVGFRKGSDLTEALNKFFVESYNDGSMMKCAEKYGVQETIISQE